MKLIIDIPDEAYKDEKMALYFGCYSRKLHSTLYNGTPLNHIRSEIADLGDADYDYEGYYKAVTDALNIIDKYTAGSEDMTKEQNYMRGYKDGRSDVLDEIRVEIGGVRDFPFITHEEYEGLRTALKILSKYTAESEGRE